MPERNRAGGKKGTGMLDTHPAGNDLRSVVLAAAALHGIYSEAELARSSNVSRNTIQRWWTGSVPSGESLGRLAEVTGIEEGLLLRVARGEDLEWRLAPAEPEPDVEQRLDAMQLRLDAMTEALRQWQTSTSPPRPPGRPRARGR